MRRWTGGGDGGNVAIVGRRAELDELDRFLGPDGPAAAVLLDGEAGIGKTTIWREGVRRARQRGLRILVALPSESETRLPYAALADLLAGVPDDAIDALPRLNAPPVVSGVPERQPNVFGRYREPVAIDWQATDDSGQASDPADTLAASDGKDVLYSSGPSCDPSGNCADGDVRGVVGSGSSDGQVLGGESGVSVDQELDRVRVHRRDGCVVGCGWCAGDRCGRRSGECGREDGAGDR